MGFGDMFSLVNGIIILTFVLIIPTLLIIVFVAASKVIKRYLKNGELMEEKLRMELDERQKPRASCNGARKSIEDEAKIK